MGGVVVFFRSPIQEVGGSIPRYADLIVKCVMGICLCNLRQSIQPNDQGALITGKSIRRVTP